MDGSWFHYFNGTPLHTSTVYVCWGCCTWWTTPTHAGPCCRSYKSVKEGNLMVSRAWDLVCMSPKNRSHVVPGVPVIEFKVALLVAVVLQRQGHVLLENPQQSLALSLRTCFWELTNHKLCVLLLPIPPSPRSSTTHGLRKILRTRGFFEQLTWLGMFGGKTWKPVRLVSDDPCVAGFYRRG